MNLNICVYNLENLFIQKAAPELPPYTPYKTESKLDDLATVFKEIDADIFALSEIGTTDSLIYFNQNYLDSAYHVAVIPGNSDRGIEIGYLIKKGLPFRYNQFSYKSSPLVFNYEHEREEFEDKEKLPIHYMSRDLCELQIFDIEDKEKTAPLAILFNVHLKSQRDPDGIDFRSEKRRQAELEFSLKNFNKAAKANPNIPIIICGDFNGNASEHETDPEFKSIYKTYHLRDVLSLADLPKRERATFFLFNGPNKLPIQLDYAFIDEKFKHRIIDPVIYRYKNSAGNPKPLPRSKYDVWNNPSDHYPIVFTLDMI